jgi:hypothetical protein
MITRKDGTVLDADSNEATVSLQASARRGQPPVSLVCAVAHRCNHSCDANVRAVDVVYHEDCKELISVCVFGHNSYAPNGKEIRFELL